MMNVPPTGKQVYSLSAIALELYYLKKGTMAASKKLNQQQKQ